MISSHACLWIQLSIVYVGLYIKWLLYLLYYNTKKKEYTNMVYGLLTCPHNNAPAQRKKNKNQVAKSLFIEVALVKLGKGAVMRKYVGMFRVIK